jgi:hypothetical protein
MEINDLGSLKMVLKCTGPERDFRYSSLYKLKFLQIECDTTYRNYKESGHMSSRSSDQSAQVGYLSRLIPSIEEEVRKLRLV